MVLKELLVKEYLIGASLSISVGNPNQPAAALAFGKNLERGVVKHDRHSPLDHRIGQPMHLVINIDDQLTYHSAIWKSEDSRVAVEARGDDMT
jgi:hypothetical protein